MRVHLQARTHTRTSDETTRWVTRLKQEPSHAKRNRAETAPWARASGQGGRRSANHLVLPNLAWVWARRPKKGPLRRGSVNGGFSIVFTSWDRDVPHQTHPPNPIHSSLARFETM